MKKPYKPYTPQKPITPSKTVRITHRLSFDEYDRNLRMSITDLLKQIPEGVSNDDIEIIREDSWSYDGRMEYTSVYCEYYTNEVNTQYDIEYKRHLTKLKAYERKLVKHEAEMKAFSKEKE